MKRTKMQMRSGGIIIPVIYVGIVIFVLTPLWAELAEASIIENSRDLLGFYRFILSGYIPKYELGSVSLLGIWSWILVMIFSQALFLNWAMLDQGQKNNSPISVRLAIYSAALLFAVMTHAMLNGIIFAVDGPEFKAMEFLENTIDSLTGNPEIFNEITTLLVFPVGSFLGRISIGDSILIMIYALILWALLAIPWACLFYYVLKNPTEQVQRLCSWLLWGAVIMLIAVILCHRNSVDSWEYSTVHTSFGIVTGLAVLLLSLIPRLYLLWREYMDREAD